MTIEVGGGGGGVFVSSFASGGLSINSGGSGNLIPLTPPSGERVKLNILVASSSSIVGIYVKIAGVNVITNLRLGSLTTNLTNGFIIGRQSGPNSFYNLSGAHPEIMGGVNEQIIVYSSGAISRGIKYGYETGALK